MTTDAWSDIQEFRKVLERANVARRRAQEELKVSEEEVRKWNLEMLQRVPQVHELWAKDIERFESLATLFKTKLSNKRAVLSGINNILAVVRQLSRTAFVRTTTETVLPGVRAVRESKMATGTPTVVVGNFGLGLRDNIQSRKLQTYEEVRYVVLNAGGIADGLDARGMHEQAKLVQELGVLLAPMRFVPRQEDDYVIYLDPVRFVLPNEVMVLIGIKAQLYENPMVVFEKESDQGVEELLRPYSAMRIELKNPTGLLIYDAILRGKESQVYNQFLTAYMQTTPPSWDDAAITNKVREAGGRWLLLDGV